MKKETILSWQDHAIKNKFMNKYLIRLLVGEVLYTSFPNQTNLVKHHHKFSWKYCATLKLLHEYNLFTDVHHCWQASIHSQIYIVTLLHSTAGHCAVIAVWLISSWEVETVFLWKVGRVVWRVLCLNWTLGNIRTLCSNCCLADIFPGSWESVVVKSQSGWYRECFA